MKNIWFIADTHFDHQAILKHQPNRKFANTNEMGDVFCETINKYVKRNDLLIHAGDFAWRASKVGRWRSKINVKEIWVTQGNHDAKSLRKHVSRLEQILFFKTRDKHMVVSHYPQFSWKNSVHGSIHLYGHSHGASEDFLNFHFPHRQSMDIGIDVNHTRTGEWRPLNIEEVLESLNKGD
jgi:calcineurin-like phosphoesterase family protein